jgi:hypothetical protein
MILTAHNQYVKILKSKNLIKSLLTHNSVKYQERLFKSVRFSSETTIFIKEKNNFFFFLLTEQKNFHLYILHPFLLSPQDIFLLVYFRYFLLSTTDYSI